MVNFFKESFSKSNFNCNLINQENIYDKDYEQIELNENEKEDERNFYVISDGIITLSCNYKTYTDIKNNRTMLFDIILNDYNIVIGDISFYFCTTKEIEYGGNITYNINDEYRNNHYATRALRLIKNLLKEYEYDGNKDIYISTNPYDIYAQNVAKNNDAFLFYEGRVPEDNSLCYLNGMKYVKIYRIEM